MSIAVLLLSCAIGAGAQQAQPSSPKEAKGLLALAEQLEKAGRVADADATYRKLVGLHPKEKQGCGALAGFLSRPLWNGKSKFDEAIATLERCAAIDPNDAQGYLTLATSYWDKAYRDPALDDKQKDDYASKGLLSVDKALKLKPDFFEAVIYKGLLYRIKAMATQSAALRAQYIESAEALRKKGLELKKQFDADRTWMDSRSGGVVGGVVGQLPPPPPSVPVRVGGQIKEPKRLVNVNPVYPEIAQSARVQGIVILECTIAPDGSVSDVKVLRGIPLLDQAAIDAVKQWRYTPTLLNDVPVPVIMTVTVNFSLS